MYSSVGEIALVRLRILVVNLHNWMKNMSAKDKNFHVGLKAFLQNGSLFLALKDADGEYWDIPGGRIEASEIDQPVTECLRRELLEELGLNIRFDIETIFDVAKFRVQPSNQRAPGLNLFLVFYRCRYRDGEIILNREATKYEWLTKETYKYCRFGGQQRVVDQFVKKYLG